MKSGKKNIGMISVLLLGCFLFFWQLYKPKEGWAKQILSDLATEAVMTGSTNDWFYDVYPVGEEANGKGVWRIHKKTGEREHISEGAYYAILVLGEKVYVQDCINGVYQMDPDGSNLELISEGYNILPKLCYQNGWIYFIVNWYFCRYHIQTGKVYKLHKSEMPPLTFGFDLVVGGDFLYSRGEAEGKYGIWQYNLVTGKSEVCVDLKTGREAFANDNYNKQPMCLTDCGDYLVLIYYGETNEKRIEKIYATEKGKRITNRTVWKEVQFPDMQKGSALPFQSLWEM